MLWPQYSRMKKKQEGKSWIKSRTAINVTRSRPGPRQKKRRRTGQMDDKFYLFRENLAHLRKWSKGSSCQDCWSGMGKKIAPVRAMDKSGYPDTKPGSGQARRHRRIFKVRVRELFPEK